MEKREIIAEIANAHQGSVDLALELAQKSASAGADALKFQIYFAHELLVRSHPRFEHFDKQSFSESDWFDLIRAAKAFGSKIYTDVFGMDALKLAHELGVDGYKIHSSDLSNVPLMTHVSRIVKGTDKKIFLSTGGCTAREIAQAIKICKGHTSIVLMHGFQSYPTAVEDSCLQRLNWLHDHYGEYAQIGYQDHVSGDDPFALTLPLMAMAMGAQVLEKHVTLDRAAQGVDFYSSLEPEEFQKFVLEIRRAELSLGTKPEAFSDSERHYRKTVKKRHVAARHLEKDTILTASDLMMKRVSDGDQDIADINQLLGRPLNQDVAHEAVMNRGCVKNVIWGLVVARCDSNRLPGKALLDVAGVPALQHLLERLKLTSVFDRVVLCTTTEEQDEALSNLARAVDIDVYRGPVDNVLKRMIGALKGHEVDIIARITGDDILIDPEYVERGLEHHLRYNAEYTAMKALPSGTEVEFYDVNLLKFLDSVACDTEGTEYLTYYITHQIDQFRTASAPVEEKHSRTWRLTLDTAEDYEVIKTFLIAMKEAGKQFDYKLDDIVAYFEQNPEVLKLNSEVRQRQHVAHVNTAIEWKRLLEK